MNRNQVAWAKEHDWFKSAEPTDTAGNWAVSVTEKVEQFDVKTGEVVGYTDVTIWFDSFTKLRWWAGY